MIQRQADQTQNALHNDKYFFLAEGDQGWKEFGEIWTRCYILNIQPWQHAKVATFAWPVPDAVQRANGAIKLYAQHSLRVIFWPWSSRATGGANMAERRCVFTERKGLFPDCNKTQTPRECQGAAPLHNTSSPQNHRDKLGKVKPTAEVSRLQSSQLFSLDPKHSWKEEITE